MIIVLQCRCRDLQRSVNEISHYLVTGLSEDKTPSESIVSGRNNPVSLGALWQKEINNWIGPTVKHERNDAMHVLHYFCLPSSPTTKDLHALVVLVRPRGLVEVDMESLQNLNTLVRFNSGNRCFRISKIEFQNTSPRSPFLWSVTKCITSAKRRK